MEPDRQPSPLVLVCEDTEAIRRLIRINLELDGFDVVQAGDGQAALEYLRDAANPLPAVVTVDAAMAPRDGWWTIQAIRADPRLRGIPVVLVTASVQLHDRAQASEAGFDAFVAKPFEPQELVAVIARLAATRAPPEEQP